MPEQTIFSLSAIVALVPSALLPFRKDHSCDMIFWLGLAVAVAG